MEKQKPTIVWDWDGTLVNSFHAIHQAFNAALESCGHPLWSYEEAQKRIARSAREIMPVIFGDNAEKAIEIFYATYKEIAPKMIAAHPGREELLTALGQKGYRQLVVSNKRGPLLRAECVSLGWEKHFSALVGANDAEIDKPNPASLHLAYEKAQLIFNPLCDVYIGDSPIDAILAKNVGMRCILLAGETHSFEDLKPHTEDVMMFSELKDALVNL